MRSLALFAITFLSACLFVQASAADIQLPKPQKTGGKPMFEVIDQRSSARGSDFPSEKIPEETLSTILWAASGHNRDGRLWTVPMAMGKPPYCKIYLTSTDGVYLYHWKNHSLELVSDENIHADIPMQKFAKDAPLNLYIVADGKMLNDMNSPFGDEFGLVLAGAMSQNIYLACQGLDVGARLIYSIQREEAFKKLRLSPGDKPYFAIVLGKK